MKRCYSSFAAIFLFQFLINVVIVKAQDIDAYKDYDFVAGERTIFEDAFSDGTSAKPLANWALLGGKASVLKEGEVNCLSIDEYYTKLKPILFSKKALPDSFSVEYDTWLDNGYDGNPGIEIHLMAGDNEIVITPNKHVMTVAYPGADRLTKDNPEAYFGENKFYDRWVHISMSMYHQQLKVYLDQNKMIELADAKLKPVEVVVTGNTAQQMKILLKNFRIATGFPQKIKLENGKFITRAIKFDVNKATLKPESITILKKLQQFLMDNPGVNFEIGGHTDADGDDAYNMALSQQRADAVRNQLINMGIPAGRLTAKGYGETKPIAPNNSAEGKANNRRVEFVKAG